VNRLEKHEAGRRAVPPSAAARAAAILGAACAHCPDVAGGHADISFGGIGESAGWTLVIVRTGTGERLWTDAVDTGVVEVRPAEEDATALDLSTGMSRARRRPAEPPDGAVAVPAADPAPAPPGPMSPPVSPPAGPAR